MTVLRTGRKKERVQARENNKQLFTLGTVVMKIGPSPPYIPRLAPLASPAPPRLPCSSRPHPVCRPCTIKSQSIQCCSAKCMCPAYYVPRCCLGFFFKMMSDSHTTLNLMYFTLHTAYMQTTRYSAQTWTQVLCSSIEVGVNVAFCMLVVC